LTKLAKLAVLARPVIPFGETSTTFTILARTGRNGQNWLLLVEIHPFDRPGGWYIRSQLCIMACWVRYPGWRGGGVPGGV